MSSDISISNKDTGIKYDSDKTPLYLLEYESIEELAKVLQLGATKYAPYNWKKGMDYSRVFSALQRHSWAWWKGETHDPESGLDHMAHVMCNAMFLSYYDKHPDLYKKFDNRDIKIKD